eukprot:m.54511 g.54511  ORF g.54511 m.54511 type:complete len:92 (-) comp11426_c0_seq2:112-387(-)
MVVLYAVCATFENNSSEFRAKLTVWPLLLSIFPLNPTNADLTLVNLVRLDSSISFNSKHHDLIELCWGSIGVWLVSALLSRVLQDRMFPCI